MSGQQLSQLTGKLPRRMLAACALAGAMLAGGASHAQAVSDFRLPPSTATSAPRTQGPVDPENPAASRPSAPAAPAPSPVPTIQPRPVATTPLPRGGPTIAVPRAASAPTATRPVSPLQPAPRAAPRATPAISAAPTVSPAPASPVTPSTALPFSPAAAPVAIATAEPAAESSGGLSWWWLLLPVLLIGAGAAAFALSRRREQPIYAPEIEPHRPIAHPEPAATPEPILEPEPVIPTPPPVPVALAPISLELDAVRLSLTLINATLHYRLRLTNASAVPLGPIALGVDMIGAHASLPDAHQLAQGVGLELRHEVPALAPGEQWDVSGDLRLPLASVNPIRQGTATLLVPLVRVRVEADGLTFSRAHVVGEVPAVPGGPLRPFRLDQGPRIFGEISQRELPAAA